MSPEQLRNENADARSDIHALGAVIYEMATGRRAFPENQGPPLIDAILNRPPVTPRAFNPHISPELERIVLKCLEKDPDQRYQSAREAAIDLERLKSPGSHATTPTTIGWKRVGAFAAVAVALGIGTALALNVLADGEIVSSAAERDRRSNRLPCCRSKICPGTRNASTSPTA
jgi:serine/threonine protein kinase